MAKKISTDIKDNKTVAKAAKVSSKDTQPGEVRGSEFSGFY